MSAAADCTLCGRPCPLGGVVDDVGRPVHYICRELRKPDLTRATTKRVGRDSRPSSKLQRRPKPPSLPV